MFGGEETSLGGEFVGDKLPPCGEDTGLTGYCMGKGGKILGMNKALYLYTGTNRGLAGCVMRVIVEVGCGIQILCRCRILKLTVGCRM